MDRTVNISNSNKNLHSLNPGSLGSSTSKDNARFGQTLNSSPSREKFAQNTVYHGTAGFDGKGGYHGSGGHSGNQVPNPFAAPPYNATELDKSQLAAQVTQAQPGLNMGVNNQK
tara:strand:- start:577 stop:918 length:342 start_codon:yes stop_codon:yes gene_type:complete